MADKKITTNSNNQFEFTPQISFSANKASNSTALLKTAGKYLDKDIVIKAGESPLTSGSIDASVTAKTISTASNSSYILTYQAKGTSSGYIDTNTTGTAHTVSIQESGLTGISSLPSGAVDEGIAIPSEGYLKISEGYIKDTYLSLDALLDGKADTAGTAATDIRNGYIAYDVDGKKLTGTMANVTPSVVEGNGINWGTGYIEEGSYTLNQLITDGAIDTASASTNYFTTTSGTSTSTGLAASKIGPGYLEEAQYILNGSISTSVSGGAVSGSASLTSSNVTLSDENTSGISVQPSWSASRTEVTGVANVTRGWLADGTKNIVSSSATGNGSGDTKYITAVTVGTGKSLSITNAGSLTINGGGDKGISLSNKTATVDGTVVTNSSGDLITADCVHSNPSAGFTQTQTGVVTPSVSVTNAVTVTSTASGKSYVIIDPDASVTTAAAATVQPSFTFAVANAGWISQKESQTYSASAASAVSLNNPDIANGTNLYIEIYDGLYE